MQKLVFRNGEGTEIDLTSGNYGIVNWSGLSECSQEIQSQQVPFNDGSVYLDNLLGEREMTFTIAINDDKDLHKRYELKRELISILNPKLKEGYLIYTNDFLSKQIKCIPDTPIFENKNFNDSGTLKAELVFTANNPYWEDIENNIIELNKTFTTIVNEGDVDTPVIIDIAGKTDSLKIKNTSTEKEIVLKNIDGVIEIDTSVGHKTISEVGTKLRTVSTSLDFSRIKETPIGIFIKEKETRDGTWIMTTNGYTYSSLPIRAVDVAYTKDGNIIAFPEFYNEKGEGDYYYYISSDGLNFQKRNCNKKVKGYIEKYDMYLAEVEDSIYSYCDLYYSIDGMNTWIQWGTTNNTQAGKGNIRYEYHQGKDRLYRFSDEATIATVVSDIENYETLLGGGDIIYVAPRSGTIYLYDGDSPTGNQIVDGGRTISGMESQIGDIWNVYESKEGVVYWFCSEGYATFDTAGAVAHSYTEDDANFGIRFNTLNIDIFAKREYQKETIYTGDYNNKILRRIHYKGNYTKYGEYYYCDYRTNELTQEQPTSKYIIIRTKDFKTEEKLAEIDCSYEDTDVLDDCIFSIAENKLYYTKINSQYGKVINLNTMSEKNELPFAFVKNSNGILWGITYSNSQGPRKKLYFLKNGWWVTLQEYSNLKHYKEFECDGEWFIGGDSCEGNNWWYNIKSDYSYFSQYGTETIIYNYKEDYFVAITDDYKMLIIRNGVVLNEIRPNADVYNLVYDGKNNKIIASVNYQGEILTVFLKTDGTFDIAEEYNSSNNIENPNNNIICYTGTNTQSVLISDKEEKTNVIEKLEGGLDFNLQKNENIILVTCNDDIGIEVKFKNKYVGV